jgi:transcriptional regulator with XRE-family HTH domain
MNDLERREKLRDALLHSRADAGVSQEKLAKYIGVTKKTISNWESGKGCPDYYQLKDWFDYLGLSLEDYLNDSVNSNDKLNFLVESKSYKIEQSFFNKVYWYIRHVSLARGVQIEEYKA